MIRYLKHQGIYLLFLLGTFVFPLWMFLQFSPYKAPKISYVLLGALFVSQYGFYREKDFRSKIKAQVTEILKKEQGRIPGSAEIIKRSDLVIQFRGVSIVASAVAILSLMFLFNDF